MDARLLRWEDLPLERVKEGLSRRIITGERTMVSQILLKRGTVVPVHRHENEQVSVVLSGALRFEVDGREVIVRSGEVLHLPSNVPHGAVALEDTVDLDIFSPPRQDWLDGTDDYLRRPAVSS